MKKLTLKDIKDTAWDLSKRAEDERAKWQLAVFKLGGSWSDGTTMAKRVLCRYFWIASSGEIHCSNFTSFTPNLRKVMQYSDLVQDEVKLRVDYFLSVGGKFREGDVPTDSYGSAVIIPTNTVEGWNKPCDSDSKRTIKSFSQRRSVYGVCSGSLPVLMGGLGDIWKYDIDKLIEMQIEHDAKPGAEPEPEQEATVYTQEMADNGEPMLEGMIAFCGRDTGTIKYIGKYRSVVEQGGHELYCLNSIIKPVEERTAEEKQLCDVTAKICVALASDQGASEIAKILQDSHLLAEVLQPL